MSSVSSLNSLLSSTSVNSTGINLSSLLQAATGAMTPGIDVTSAVNAAIYAAQAPERQWQAEQSKITTQISALNGIESALSAVSNDLTDLNNFGGSLAARSVSSSNTGVVSATASPGATVGTHLISVQSLATTGSFYSPALASGSAALGASTLTITSAAGAQTTFTTGSGVNTLSALANAINGSSAGVNASIVTDASGSRLALVSASSGSSSDFTVTYGTNAASSFSSASLASTSTPLQAGSFQVGDGTTTASVTVNAGDTLSTVASSINAKGLGLTASVVADASGAHLQILPQGSGTVSVSADPTLGFTRASTGANASLSVDGIPVSSASNTVTGVVSGLTLNLSGTTPSANPVTLGVSADTTQITQALSTFVSDYNTALSLVNTQFAFSTSTGSQGVLSGDSTLRSLQNSLEGITGYNAGAGSGGSIQTLAKLGITVSNDGSLSLNSATLSSALANPSDVQTFFQGTALNGFAQTFSSAIDAFNSPANGSLTSEIRNLNQQYTSLQTDVNNYETNYIASQRTVLNAQFSKAEIALQQLPAQLKQIQAELGNNNSSGG